MQTSAFQAIGLILFVGGIAAALTGWLVEQGGRSKPGNGSTVAWFGVASLLISIPMLALSAFSPAGSVEG